MAAVLYLPSAFTSRTSSRSLSLNFCFEMRFFFPFLSITFIFSIVRHFSNQIPQASAPLLSGPSPAESNYYNKIEKKMIVCRIPIIKQNPASQNSPLERGRGCVTSAHSLPNQKQTPETNKPHLKKQQQKHPNRAPHRNTPLHPQSNNSLSNRKQHPKLPSREGPGVCHAQAQPPQTKNNHPKLTDTTPKRTKYTGHKTHTKTKKPFYGKI